MAGHFPESLAQKSVLWNLQEAMTYQPAKPYSLALYSIFLQEPKFSGHKNWVTTEVHPTHGYSINQRTAG